MGRHAKAMSAESSTRQATGLHRIFRGAFAIRGASGDADGSGAPSRGRWVGTSAVLAFLLVLTFAPAVQAAKGSLDAFGSTGLRGGQFSWTLAKSGISTQTFARGTITGVAVNSNGTGAGTSPGDIYAVDRGSNRIEQLSKSGKFIRAWGYDVVLSGPDNTGANEQQTVTIPGTVTGGTFTLTAITAIGEGLTKIPPSFEGGQDRNPNQKIVNLSTSLGPFHVGDTFTNADDTNLRPTPVTVAETESVTVANFTSRAPGESTENVSAPAYRSRFEGSETTAPIAYNATAVQVQTALEALPGIGSAGVTVTGGPGGTSPFTVTFVGAGLGHNDVPQMTAGSSALTGGTASVATAVPGGGIETCGPADVCKAGTASAAAGALNSPQGLAIEQATGNVYVTDPGNRRIDVFGANGAFQGAFGWGVATGASSLEFCTATCQVGLSGGGAGEFATGFEAPRVTIGAPALAPAGSPNAGNLLVPNAADNRVDEFQPTITSGAVTGVTFVRGFGWDTVPGGATGLESCTTALTCKVGFAGGGSGEFSNGDLSSVAEDTTGAIYAVNAPSTGNCTESARCAVQKFNAAATSASDLGPAQLTHTSGSGIKTAATAVAVDPTTNEVYVVQPIELSQPENRLYRYNSSGTLQETMFKGALLGWRGPNFGYETLTSEGTERATRIMELGFDESAHHVVFGTTEEEQERIYTVGDISPEASESLAATLGEPAATGVTGEEATLHGVVTPALGVGQTRYEFEYTNGTTWTRTARQSAGNGSEIGSPGSCEAENPSSCEVEVQLRGLEPGQTYLVRLHAFIPADPELSKTSTFGKFKMLGVLPSAETSAAWWGSPASTTPDLTMRGFINPQDEVTSYYFQLVDDEQFQNSGFASAENIPLAPGDPAAKSFNTVEVQQTAYELDATKSYHYRVVAVSPSGTTFGAAKTVEPPKPGERFFELVSSGESGGLGVGGVQQVADQEERVIFTGAPFDGQISSPSTYGPKFSVRDSSGWHFVPVALDPRKAYQGIGTAVSINQSYIPAAQAERMLFVGPAGSLREVGDGQAQAFFAGDDNTFLPASPLLAPLSSEPGVSLLTAAQFPGGSADLSRLVAISPGGRTYLPGEPLIPGKNIYLINSNTLEASLLNVDSSGHQVGGVCGAELGGGIHKVASLSLDGSISYFSARPGAPITGTCSSTVTSSFRTRIFKHQGNTTTEVSKSECNRPALPEPPGACKEIAGDDVFRTASGNGSVVLFTTSRQLTNSDRDSAEDLYSYESEAHNEVQKLMVAATAGSYNLSFGGKSTGLSVIATTSSGSPALAAVSAVTGTGTVSSGSNSVTSVTNASSFFVGQGIAGAGIPGGATITAVSGSALTLSASATASGTGVSLSTTTSGSATTTSGSNTLTAVSTVLGSGTLTSGSKSVTGVTTSSGAFLVGQSVSGVGIPAGTTIASVGVGTLELSENATVSGVHDLLAGAQPFLKGQVVSGVGIPAGATITAVSGRTLTLSANATASATEVAISATVKPVLAVGEGVIGSGIPAGARISSVSANGDVTLSESATASGVGVGLNTGIPYNASAAALQSVLASLSSIGAGNVSVSGGPGDTGGSTPYLIEFKGELGGTPLAPIAITAGSLVGAATQEPFTPGGHLTQITAGEATAGHPTVGSGAEFQGIATISADGSRVYFVAKGQLTAGAAAGQPNLFVYERDAAHPKGRLHFIATLSSQDEKPVWSDASNNGREVYATPSAALDANGTETYGNGRFLIFTSVAKLVPGDTDSASDLYRYDDASGNLTCLSCAGNGTNPALIIKQPASNLLDAAASQQTRVSTPDASEVVFMTAEGLVPSDENNAMDIYLWTEGQLSVISAATGKQGTADSNTNATSFLQFNFPPAISLNGENIFFVTPARLTPDDTDRALDLYDARVEGGFSLPKPEARVCIDGEVCRGTTTEQPKLAGNGSSSFTGPGNQPVAKPRSQACPKGKVRSKGHCVIKRHPRHVKGKHHRHGSPGSSRGNK